MTVVKNYIHKLQLNLEKYFYVAEYNHRVDWKSFCLCLTSGNIQFSCFYMEWAGQLSV